MGVLLKRPTPAMQVSLQGTGVHITGCSEDEGGVYDAAAGFDEQRLGAVCVRVCTTRVRRRWHRAAQKYLEGERRSVCPLNRQSSPL